MPRLPADAFDRFLALGPTRSYAKLAMALGCSKRSVTARASREGWQEHLARIEEQGRRKTEERAIEDFAAMDERHLRTTRAMQAFALDALKSMRINSGMSAIRALDLAVKLERAISGRSTAEATIGPTLGELIAQSWSAPPAQGEGVQQQLGSTPPAPPAEPVMPPALVPRVFGEN